MIYYLIVIISVVLDQISKKIVIDNLKPIGTVPLIKDVFHFTYCENTGAAFSFLFKNIKKKNHNKMLLFGLSFILGGAIGNFIDRFFHGFVTDFFDFRLINFAIFNIADVFITIGGILFCIYILFSKDDESIF